MRLKNVKNAKEIIEKGTYYLPNPKDYIGRYKELFNNNNEIHIEIGMGKGKFIIDNAIAHKDINYIGIEKNPLYCAWAEYRLDKAENDKSIQGYKNGVFWERNSEPSE